MNTNKWNAKDYANNSSAQESWANELLEKLALKGNEHLLDIGCGDGKITHSIAK
ncbi:MAG TPA: SAM-dependent methyltransferase, partial [Desulfocapsa sulfexigens]|nr:SAM-dependent methyltransferase [Desulfocapsa sulfexigens]